MEDGGSEGDATATAIGARNLTNQVLVQALARKACCNFISSLDGPLPLAIIGSSAWSNLRAAVDVKLPASGAGFAALGLRVVYGSGTFFKGGLGRPTGLFLALDAKGWMLVPSVDAVARGLP